MLIEQGCWPAAFITKCVMASNCPPFGPERSARCASVSWAVGSDLLSVTSDGASAAPAAGRTPLPPSFPPNIHIRLRPSAAAFGSWIAWGTPSLSFPISGMSLVGPSGWGWGVLLLPFLKM